jgi:hypothetical protein
MHYVCIMASVFDWLSILVPMQDLDPSEERGGGAVVAVLPMILTRCHRWLFLPTRLANFDALHPNPIGDEICIARHLCTDGGGVWFRYI